MDDWKPATYPSLSPYLICQDAEGLIAFLEAGFGGSLFGAFSARWSVTRNTRF